MENSKPSNWQRERFARFEAAILAGELEELFPIADLRRLEAAVFSSNPASARVLEKAGFTLEGRLRAAVVKDGVILDALVYALLATNPKPTDADIDTAMSGNLCRCGTYLRIREGIHKAAGQAAKTE